MEFWMCNQILVLMPISLDTTGGVLPLIRLATLEMEDRSGLDVMTPAMLDTATTGMPSFRPAWEDFRNFSTQTFSFSSSVKWFISLRGWYYILNICDMKLKGTLRIEPLLPGRCWGSRASYKNRQFDRLWSRVLDEWNSEAGPWWISPTLSCQSNSDVCGASVSKHLFPLGGRNSGAVS